MWYGAISFSNGGGHLWALHLDCQQLSLHLLLLVVAGGARLSRGHLVREHRVSLGAPVELAVLERGEIVVDDALLLFSLLFKLLLLQQKILLILVNQCHLRL